VEKVGSGSALVNEAGATMNEIVTSVRRVTDIISEISSAGREQEIGIEQINTAVAEMDNVTQQNAALVEQAAAASQAMQEQAVKLAEMVAVFQVSGSSAAPRAPLRTPPAAAPAATTAVQPALKLAAKPAAKPAAAKPAARPAPKAPSDNSNEWEEF
jgi:methyl-accepting chemotaxis protein-1 (serine sensor receptor)